MQFWYDNEIGPWAAERGLPQIDERSIRDLLYFDPPPHRRRHYFNYQQPQTAPALAAEVVAALGDWDEAVLWVTRWGVWPSSEDWPTYYAARGARGELRSIDDTPGHWFGLEEREALTEFVTLVLQNGWDAFVLTAARGALCPVRLKISHDEFVDVQTATPRDPETPP